MPNVTRSSARKCFEIASELLKEAHDADDLYAAKNLGKELETNPRMIAMPNAAAIAAKRAELERQIGSCLNGYYSLSGTRGRMSYESGYKELARLSAVIAQSYRDLARSKEAKEWQDKADLDLDEAEKVRKREEREKIEA